MTLAGQHVPVIAWDEPGGLIPRGTVVVIPGRGELPAVYERFGRRLAADAYRVRAVTDPVLDAGLARAQISGLLADSSLPAPRVLAGSDTGALFAIMLARSGLGAAVDALVLAGLPTTPQAGSAGSWDEELGADQHHGGRHDVLNDQTHRTVAAAVVLFLERLRQDAGPRPIAVWEQLG